MRTSARSSVTSSIAQFAKKSVSLSRQAHLRQRARAAGCHSRDAAHHPVEPAALGQLKYEQAPPAANHHHIAVIVPPVRSAALLRACRCRGLRRWPAAQAAAWARACAQIVTSRARRPRFRGRARGVRAPLRPVSPSSRPARGRSARFVLLRVSLRRFRSVPPVSSFTPRSTTASRPMWHPAGMAMSSATRALGPHERSSWLVGAARLVLRPLGRLSRRQHRLAVRVSAHDDIAFAFDRRVRSPRDEVSDDRVLSDAASRIGRRVAPERRAFSDPGFRAHRHTLLDGRVPADSRPDLDRCARADDDLNVWRVADRP